MNYQNRSLCYLPKPKAEADDTDVGFDNSWYHAQPHSIVGIKNDKFSKLLRKLIDVL